MKKKIHQYGKYITIKQQKMYVSAVGNGKKVILLLPGLGSACPIIEMKALASFLSDKYTVVTIEYFGYGMSDDTNLIRSVDNIVDDIHEAMQVMGYKKYSIAAHSISGLYCLAYTNKYPDEVESFIGIDSSVPQQIDKSDETDRMYRIRLKRKFNDNWFKQCISRWGAKKFLQLTGDYKYSKEDIKTYSEVVIRIIPSNAIINETHEARANFNRLKGITFPESVKVLLLVASQTELLIPGWKQWHKEVLNSTGTVVEMKGRHALHMQHPKAVAEKINVFISDSVKKP